MFDIQTWDMALTRASHVLPAVASNREKYVALASGPSGNVFLFESKFKYKTEEEAAADSGFGPEKFVRNPLFLGAVMMVIFYQSSK